MFHKWSFCETTACTLPIGVNRDDTLTFWNPLLVGPLVHRKGLIKGLFFIGKMVGAPWDGGPLVINPIYTLYSGYLLGISPFKGLFAGLKQLGYHPRVPTFSL